jgi:hypothetical protein
MARSSWVKHSMLTKRVLVQIIEAAENEEAVVKVGLGRIYSNKTNLSQNSANPHDHQGVAEDI